jgi:hypothetical protein
MLDLTEIVEGINELANSHVAVEALGAPAINISGTPTQSYSQIEGLESVLCLIMPDRSALDPIPTRRPVQRATIVFTTQVPGNPSVRYRHGTTYYYPTGIADIAADGKVWIASCTTYPQASPQ